MKYEAVVFDLDGTLLDTLEDLRNSVNYALRLHGFPERTYEEIRTFVGNGVRNLMLKAVPGGDATPSFEAVFADFRAHYAVHWRELTAPYEGVVPLVEELHRRGLKLAVVSNKSDAEVKNLCTEFFGGKISCVRGEVPEVPRKPAPDSVFLALQSLGVACGAALYVGDSEVDVRTACNAGLDCAAVTWGFRTKDELKEAGAETFVDVPAELLRMI
ncbi:MAG: HAD family hydrolase [Mailhella sp.]|nr:HAD family hydrolase [Mailhella sp.]